MPGGDLSAISGLIRNARTGGTWTGNGITSSAAASRPDRLTGLSAIEVGGEIRVKYTWNGDVDQNRLIDGADYFQLDRGFLANLPGYGNGDLDFSGGNADGDDYFMIDRAFLSHIRPGNESAPATVSAALGSPLGLIGVWDAAIVLEDNGGLASGDPVLVSLGPDLENARSGVASPSLFSRQRIEFVSEDDDLLGVELEALD